jgi:asparagine synthase (glutamine-hydrolysing)
MCGFVALISPSIPIQEDLLTVMRDRLIHRGPDNGSNWIQAKGRVALAHRRLSIIDISHSADQPMLSENLQDCIAFNGEIYNYLELKDELISLGHNFKTKSDTEVLLIALQEWGENAIPKLNGMFAFAYWEGKSKRMLITRDRFGEKPLFVGRGSLNTTIIASEMKAILPHPLMHVSINNRALSMFGNGMWLEDDETTFFEGIERFPPAHASWYSEDGTQLKRWRYWTPDYTAINDDIKPREAVEKFSELFERSINLRLRADVPVGSSLSGGLDSSAIVGHLAQKRTSSKFTQNTFSAIFPADPTMSEDREIDAVVKFTGVNSYLVSPNPKKLMNESALLHWHQEEPFFSASIYLQWCVARLARENNTKVLLDGQGADELLGGYQFYFKQYQLDLLDKKQLPLAVRESDKFNRRLNIASNLYVEANRRFNSSVAYSSQELSKLNASKIYSLYPNSTGLAPLKPGNRLRRTLSEAMLYNSLPMLLRYADRNSMAFSREARLPFLDYNLVDFCISLPDEYYIRNGWQKWILRESSKNLIPNKICWRADKVGYAAPLDIWLRNELKEWAFERVMDSSLFDVSGYDKKLISNLWDTHQSGQSNNSWALWKWISLSEWLADFGSGCWRTGFQPYKT